MIGQRSERRSKAIVAITPPNSTFTHLFSVVCGGMEQIEAELLHVKLLQLLLLDRFFLLESRPWNSTPIGTLEILLESGDVGISRNF